MPGPEDLQCLFRLRAARLFFARREEPDRSYGYARAYFLRDATSQLTYGHWPTPVRPKKAECQDRTHRLGHRSPHRAPKETKYANPHSGERKNGWYGFR